MALLSELKYQQGMKVSEISAFKGLNRRGTIKSGELANSFSLGFQNYPALSAKKNDTNYCLFPVDTLVTALFEWDGHIITVAGTSLYYDGNVLGTVTAGEKQFAVVNTKLIIWPDKKYIDLTTGAFTDLGTSFKTTASLAFSGKTLTYSGGGTLKCINTAYSGQMSAYHIPSINIYGNVNNSFDLNSIKYSPSTDTWTLPTPTVKTAAKTSTGTLGLAGDVVVVNQAVKYPLFTDERVSNSDGFIGVLNEPMSYTYKAGSGGDESDSYSYYYNLTIYQINSDAINLNSIFSAGDHINITGTTSNNKTDIKITAATSDTLTFDTAFTTETVAHGVVLSRIVPDMDFICSCNNRLYGVSNTAVSSIYNASTKKFDTFYSRCLYVSALGEPDKFYDFSGVDTDSYQVAVASEGDFTAAVALDGSVIFMKEKLVYRLYGEYPSNFYLSEYAIPGCAAGCAKTCKVINEVLYYLSRHGVYAYNGNAPTYISWELGDIKAVKACAGVKETRYYISISDTSGGNQTFAYDTDLGFWLRSDILYYTDYASVNNDLYYAYNNGVFILEAADTAQNRIWWAILKDEDEGTIERKYYQYIRLRLHLPEGSYLKVTWYFDDGPALYSQIIRSQGKYADRTVIIAMNNNRADRITIRLDGSGDIQVKTLQRIYTLGTGEAR